MPEIRQSTVEDLQWIEGLIRAYPYKDYQTNYYRVDRKQLDDFNIARIGKMLQSESNDCYSVFPHDGPVGAFIIAPSKWHTDLFGVQYHKIGSYWARSDSVKDEIVDAILAVGTSAGAEVLDIRTDADDLPFAQAAERAGALLLGTSVKYGLRSKDLDKTEVDSYLNSSRNGVAIRSVETDDLDWIRKVAEESHSVSYFFNNPALPTEKTHELFSRWAVRCAKGLADSVLVMTVDGEPAGFATLLLPKSLSEALETRFGVLDFIAISSKFKGRGLGTKLAKGAFAWLAERADFLEARTMVNNYPAQALYGRLGFRVIAADIHLQFDLR